MNSALIFSPDFAAKYQLTVAKCSKRTSSIRSRVFIVSTSGRPHPGNETTVKERKEMIYRLDAEINRHISDD